MRIVDVLDVIDLLNNAPTLTDVYRLVLEFMRTGKRLPEKRTEIVIQFKPVPHSIFDNEEGEAPANRMIIELQPEEDISLTVMNKRPGLDKRMQLQPITMSLAWGVDGK